EELELVAIAAALAIHTAKRPEAIIRGTPRASSWFRRSLEDSLKSSQDFIDMYLRMRRRWRS
ncbi:MAG: hypothetical protein DRO12_03165, partial [Thermoprotei archaeon]